MQIIVEGDFPKTTPFKVSVHDGQERELFPIRKTEPFPFQGEYNSVQDLEEKLKDIPGFCEAWVFALHPNMDTSKFYIRGNQAKGFSLQQDYQDGSFGAVAQVTLKTQTPAPAYAFRK